MKFLLTILLFVLSVTISHGQYDIAGDYKIGGNVGIGTTTPSHKFDLRGGAVQVINYSAGGYTFLGRDNDPGNDSYFYHLMSTNYHILGSSKNGTAPLRKLGFAIGTSDTEADIKMTIDNNGNTGIGIATPSSQLHIASNNDHAFTISRANGTHGFRIFRNAYEGNVYFQIGTGTGAWETKIKIGEGEGANTKLVFNPDGGNVLIGKSTQANGAYKLDVNGSIRSNEVVVNTTGADFVFEENYELKKLDAVEKFIKANKHLPDIEPAKEMAKNGVELGKMDMKLLQKIEELTLYMIAFKKEMDDVKEENQQLKDRIIALEKN
jgi:hypothetical protein